MCLDVRASCRVVQYWFSCHYTWQQSNHLEKYKLNIFFTALIAYCVVWEKTMFSHHSGFGLFIWQPLLHSACIKQNRMYFTLWTRLSTAHYCMILFSVTRLGNKAITSLVSYSPSPAKHPSCHSSVPTVYNGMKIAHLFKIKAKPGLRKEEGGIPHGCFWWSSSWLRDSKCWLQSSQRYCLSSARWEGETLAYKAFNWGMCVVQVLAIDWIVRLCVWYGPWISGAMVSHEYSSAFMKSSSSSPGKISLVTL